jgi:carboxyl-terminal processing protease
MRKSSIVVLILVILTGVLFLILHKRHAVQQLITGIGVQLTVRNNELQIMGVLPGTPAAKAGLHRGLIIQQIDGTDVTAKPLADCVAMTRGPVGSKVQLEVIDPAQDTTNVVEVTREALPVLAGPTNSPPGLIKLR